MKIKINRILLPFKLHNFAFFGGEAFVMPYLADLATDKGISGFVIGGLFTVMSFSLFLSKIAFGSVADVFQNHKTVLLINLIITAASSFFIIFIPNIKEPSCPSERYFTCKNNSIDICASEILVCQENFTSALSVQCEISCSDCEFDNTACRWTFNDSKHYFVNFENSCISFPQSETHAVCSVGNYSCETMCSCILSSMGSNDSSEVYTSWPFLLFCFLMVISFASYGIVVSLADTAVLDHLNQKEHLFGQQRLWGTMGWGICIIISGQVFTMASKGHCTTNYTPGFYILLAILIVDFIILYKANIISNPKPKDMFKHIIELYKSMNVIMFTFAVFVNGFSTGTLWTFQVVFIRKTLNGPAILPGLAMGVQTWGGELLFFLLSGTILKKLGNTSCMFLSLAATGCRYILYSILWEPWTILPVELIHGLTFALFFANMASYASIVAPEGMSATMQGIFQAVFEGFGVGLGSLASGYLLDNYGGREMYRIVGIATAIYGVFYALVMFILTRKTKEYKFPSLEPTKTDSQKESCHINSSFETAE